MLAGMLLLGVIAATALPDLMDSIRGTLHGSADTPEEDEDQPPDDPVLETGDLLLPDPATGLDTPDADPEEDPEGGADLFVAPEPGRVLVEDFRPGSDSLTIAVPEGADEFTAHDADGDTVAFLDFQLDGGIVEVQFPGLDSVPVDDIMLRLADPDSPTGDADIALSLLLETEDDTEDDTAIAAVIDPVDPTLPDDPEPVEGGTGAVLDPVDPTLPDPTPDPVEPEGEVLWPVDDDVDLDDDARGLADLVTRDGGSPVGLRQGTADVTGLTDENDTVALPAEGAAGRLTWVEAMAELSADDGADVAAVDLGGGDDAFQAGGAPVYGFGGDGDDTLSAGTGSAALFGGAGDDVLTGADGNGAVLLHGGAGNDLISGGSAGEYLDGGEHGETPGVAGDDTISGGGGDDVIRGGFGADRLSGGDGNDWIDHRGTDAERIIAERHEFAWHIDGGGDALDGGDGDDTLVFDRGDSVTGGAGSDIFWLYSDAGASGFADISDFRVGEDFLRISLNPQVSATGNVAVLVSEDGADGLVQVDGETVAILRGAPGATMTDIYVETRPDVFA